MIFDDFPCHGYRAPLPCRDNLPISRFTLAIQQWHWSIEIRNRKKARWKEKKFFPLLSFFFFSFFFFFFFFFSSIDLGEIGKGFSRDPKKRWIYGPIKRSLSLLFKEEHYSINEEMEFLFFLFFFLNGNITRFIATFEKSSNSFWSFCYNFVKYIYIYFLIKIFNFLKSLPSLSRISFFRSFFFFSSFFSLSLSLFLPPFFLFSPRIFIHIFSRWLSFDLSLGVEPAFFNSIYF